jgi:peptidoglycan hydrolase CwlO-like protein
MAEITVNRFDSRVKHSDLVKAPCNILADFLDVRERLAAAEQQAKDLLTAQVDLLAEVANLTAKNSEKDLTLADLTKRIDKLEAKAAKLADMVG